MNYRVHFRQLTVTIVTRTIFEFPLNLQYTLLVKIFARNIAKNAKKFVLKFRTKLGDARKLIPILLKLFSLGFLKLSRYQVNLTEKKQLRILVRSQVAYFLTKSWLTVA